MRPISFENLRRLMGGGRKRKENSESSFKRSDSFKRISIKRNYLERGAKARVPHPPSASRTKHEKLLLECSSSDERAPTPPPRRRGSSIATDSSIEIIRFERSPTARRRQQDSSPPPPPPPHADSAISVNLGRVWLDAPLAMAPRSLELPRGAVAEPVPAVASAIPTTAAARRAHHSLDSALKEKRDDGRGSRRLPGTPAVSRTLSSSQAQAQTQLPPVGRLAPAAALSSSKDSGFSFSISIPRLSDLSPTASGVAVNSGGGFFRKRKKAARPNPSVSRDGYFKRTSVDPTLEGSRRNSVRRASGKKRGSQRRKKSTATTAGGTARSDLYQVVVGRTPRSLQALRLDPMIFVAPERRRANAVPQRHNIIEIRGWAEGTAPRKDDADPDTEDEGLYECISGDFDESIRSPASPASLASPSLPSSPASPASPAPPETPPEPPKRPHVSRVMITMADHASSDADTEDETYVPLGYSPVPRRRPVQRRKSARKNVKYLAKPSIHRAPSTLRRPRKSEYSAMSPHRLVKVTTVDSDDADGEWI